MLTDKNLIFISEYVKTFNATAAAMEAGYSKKTAYSIGCELLKKPEISKAIKEHIESRIGPNDKIILENVEFWRSILHNENASENARLKASEYLGKYVAMFTERTDVQLTGYNLGPVKFDFVEPPEKP